MFRSVAVIAVVLLALTACDKRASQRMIGGSTMGTSWSIKVIAVEHPLEPTLLTQRVQATLDGIEAKMSNWREDSEVSRFNAMTAGCMPVSKETLTVAAAALEISRHSDGVFDITLGPLIELWGFGKRIGSDNVPSDTEIQAAAARVGYDGIRVDANTGQLCKSQDNLSINMSAIAKGYGVDEVAKTLEAVGYQRYLVEVGGELFAKGLNNQEQAWSIGVEKPVAEDRQIMANVIIPLVAKGLATSGDYRNFFEKDGRRYSHLIDPTTGYPVAHHVASVTVVAESSMLADGWATALLVLGAQRGLELANELGLAVLILEHGESGQLNAYTSDAWQFDE